MDHDRASARLDFAWRDCRRCLLQASRDVEPNGCDPETEEHRACGQQPHDKDGTRGAVLTVSARGR